MMDGQMEKQCYSYPPLSPGGESCSKFGKILPRSLLDSVTDRWIWMNGQMDGWKIILLSHTLIT